MRNKIWYAIAAEIKSHDPDEQNARVSVPICRFSSLTNSRSLDIHRKILQRMSPVRWEGGSGCFCNSRLFDQSMVAEFYNRVANIFLSKDFESESWSSDAVREAVANARSEATAVISETPEESVSVVTVDFERKIFYPSNFQWLGAIETPFLYCSRTHPQGRTCEEYYRHEGIALLIVSHGEVGSDDFNPMFIEISLKEAVSKLALASQPIPSDLQHLVRNLDVFPVDDERIDETVLKNSIVFPVTKAAAIESTIDILANNSLRMFKFLVARNHKAKYDSLLQMCWEKEISDAGIKKAIERLGVGLNEMSPQYFEIENEHSLRRVRLVPMGRFAEAAE